MVTLWILTLTLASSIAARPLVDSVKPVLIYCTVPHVRLAMCLLFREPSVNLSSIVQILIATIALSLLYAQLVTWVIIFPMEPAIEIFVIFLDALNALQPRLVSLALRTTFLTLLELAVYLCASITSRTVFFAMETTPVWHAVLALHYPIIPVCLFVTLATVISVFLQRLVSSAAKDIHLAVITLLVTSYVMTLTACLVIVQPLVLAV